MTNNPLVPNQGLLIISYNKATKLMQYEVVFGQAPNFGTFGVSKNMLNFQKTALMVKIKEIEMSFEDFCCSDTALKRLLTNVVRIDASSVITSNKVIESNDVMLKAK